MSRSNSRPYPPASAAASRASDAPTLPPPLVGRLARLRDHCVDEDEGGHREAPAHEGRGEPAERLGDQHDLAALTGRAHNHVGVLGQSRRFIVAGQIDRDRLVAFRFEQRTDALPVPGHAAGAGDQHEAGHDTGSGSRVWKSSVPTHVGRTAMRTIWMPCCAMASTVALPCSSP